LTDWVWVELANIISKNLVAGATLCCLETTTLMTWPFWSTAEETYRHTPAIRTKVSSTNQRSAKSFSTSLYESL